MIAELSKSSGLSCEWVYLPLLSPESTNDIFTYYAPTAMKESWKEVPGFQWCVDSVGGLGRAIEMLLKIMWDQVLIYCYVTNE